MENNILEKSRKKKVGFLNKVKDLFLNIFFPEACLTCGENGETLCKKCLEEIMSEHTNENYKNIDWIHHCLSYKNPKLKTSLFYLKYHYTKSVAKYLAKICEKDFYNFIKKFNNNLNNVLILPIPISKKRMRERNYNQTELIAKELIQELKEKRNINLEQTLYIDLLLKNKDTIKFANTHSHTERENLIRDAFQVDQKYKNSFLENKIIILIDDITTTGTTFYEARNTLLKNGAVRENIFGFAIAH